MMKKTIVLMLLSACFLTGCNTKTAETEESKSELEKFLEETSNSESGDEAVNKEQQTINLSDYEFIIPEGYNDSDIEQIEKMRTNLLSNKTIEITKQDISVLVYGLVYDEQNDMAIFPVYIFNNTQQEISDLKFTYSVDLTELRGMDEGSFNFQYNYTGNEQEIPSLSIMPVFIGVPEISKLKEPQDFYSSIDLKDINFDVKNIIINFK